MYIYGHLGASYAYAPVTQVARTTAFYAPAQARPTYCGTVTIKAGSYYQLLPPDSTNGVWKLMITEPGGFTHQVWSGPGTKEGLRPLWALNPWLVGGKNLVQQTVTLLLPCSLVTSALKMRKDNSY